MAEEAQAGRSKVKKSTPRFYAIILDDPDRDLKLEIPGKFAADYGSQLSKGVVLKLPSGAEWPVRVARSGKKMWFDEGWRDFAKFYSLAPGYFLVFEYYGNVRFLVYIFDHTTATEIDYKTQQGNVHVKEECGVDSVDEHLEKWLPSPKAREKPDLRASQPRSLRRRTTNNDPNLREHEEDEDGQNRNATSQKRKKLMSEYDKASTLARANAAFKPRNHSFKLVMQPSFLPPLSKPYPPARFLLEHFKYKSGDIVLQLPDRRAWIVAYCVSGKVQRAYFNPKSWGTFARDTGLKMGDVCTFELVEGERKLNVIIIRADQDAHPDIKPNPSPLLAEQGDPTKHQPNQGDQVVARIKGNTALLAARAFTSNSKQPFFTEVVSHLHLSTGLVVPFCKHIKKASRVAELYVAGKCWGVSILQYKWPNGTPRYLLAGGWKKFARSNSLKAGDVCIYELMKSEEEVEAASRNMIDTILLSVRIFKD